MIPSIKSGKTLIRLEDSIIMGILNITPDSFYDGGKYNSPILIENQINKMLEDGASIIDIGAFSSRPGAKEISLQEEIQRLDPVMNILKNKFNDTSISVDTYRSQVVEYVYDRIGSFIVNDISGGMFDKNMFKTCGKFKLPYIVMHMQGTPETMQNKTSYTDIIEDIIKYFIPKINLLIDSGVNDIIIDPGIGFGKTVDQNFHIIKHLREFKIFEKPILAGISRKSLIYKSLNCSPAESLNGTSILNTFCIKNGANILRVHDVKEAKECLLLSKKLVKC